MIKIEFKAKVWRYPGAAGWHFVTLPKKQAKAIKSLFKEKTRPWGSLKVDVEVGETAWSTSIFADTKRDSFLLPIKAPIRKKEGIAANKSINVKLSFEI